MPPARPTLRCLREDLELPLPPMGDPLDELGHPLVRKAGDHFGDPAGPRDRIRSIDDQVFFKVKCQRWRGAVWVDRDQAWLVAAGWREDGSPDDFYEALASAARTARSSYNATHTRPLATGSYVGRLLPTADDRDRYAVEAGTRLRRQIKATVHQLVRASVLSGCEHTAEVTGATLGILVCDGQDNEIYVAVRITGSIPDNLVFVVLALVPGCDRDSWYPELAMPTRSAVPNEQVWSNLMDPAVAAELLAD